MIIIARLINTFDTAGFVDRVAILKDVVWPKKLFDINDGQRNFVEDMCNDVVSKVSADDLSPLGTKSSAGAVMRMCECHIFTGLMYVYLMVVTKYSEWVY